MQKWKSDSCDHSPCVPAVVPFGFCYFTRGSICCNSFLRISAASPLFTRRKRSIAATERTLLCPRAHSIASSRTSIIEPPPAPTSCELAILTSEQPTRLPELVVSLATFTPILRPSCGALSPRACSSITTSTTELRQPVPFNFRHELIWRGDGPCGFGGTCGGFGSRWT